MMVPGPMTQLSPMTVLASVTPSPMVQFRPMTTVPRDAARRRAGSCVPSPTYSDAVPRARRSPRARRR